MTLAGASARPYGGYFDEIADTLADALADRGGSYADAVEKVVIYRDEMTLHIRRRHLPVVAQTLRDDPRLRFELCLGVNGALSRRRRTRTARQLSTLVDHARPPHPSGSCCPRP